MLALVAIVLAIPAAPPEDDFDKAAAALLQVFRHPEARGERLEDSRRAIRALTAMGKPAVPKILDAMLTKGDTAGAYASLALKEMPAADAAEGLAKRWENVGSAERWILAPYLARFDGKTVISFALACLDDKDITIRSHAWGFVLEHSHGVLLAPAKDRYLKALAGDEAPSLRWMMIRGETVFDAEKEIDILITLLKPNSWAAKGEGQMPFDGYGPPWWPDGRIYVVEALGARKAKRAAPAMLDLLVEKGKGKAYLGHAIIPLLGEFGHKEAIPELNRILEAKEKDLLPSEEAGRLRARAARSLWQLGDTSGRKLVAEQLKSKRWFERRFAAETLELYGTKEDIPLLAAALDDEDWGVQRHTCNALARITGAKVGDPQFRRGEADVPHWKEWLKKNPQK